MFLNIGLTFLQELTHWVDFLLHLCHNKAFINRVHIFPDETIKSIVLWGVYLKSSFFLSFLSRFSQDKTFVPSMIHSARPTVLPVAITIDTSKVVLLCEILKSGDEPMHERTDTTCENSDHYWPWLWVGLVVQKIWKMSVYSSALLYLD